MIQVGGPYTPETLNEGKVNLGNPNNPVNATYSGGGSGTVSDFIWTRSSSTIYPTTLTDRVRLGANTFVGAERLRVLGETNTDTLRTANAYIDTARIRSGSNYANITASLTTTRNLLLPDASGTIALTSDIPLFANAALLATYTNTNAAITNAISYSHQHSNYSTLNGITPTLISNWNNAYSWGNHALVGYITAETDPIFVASAAYNITGINITNWNTAYGWGNHASAGYLTEEIDPIFIASAAYDIDSTDISNWDTAYTDSHTHSNKALLDTLTNAGAGIQFLTDDGTYKSITTTVAGNDTEIQFNDGGSSFGGDSTYTFNKTTKLVTSYDSLISNSLYLGDNTAYITNSSGDLSFTDINAGTVTLSTLLTGVTNYWSTTTGGIYYGAGTDKVGINTSSLTEALTIDGNIAATNFNSSYLRYKNSNLLLGPNAGDNETGDNLLYISNSDTANPLVKGDFLNQSIEFNADTYINSVKRLCFGSSEVYIRRDSTTDDMLFSDPNTNSGDPVKLSDFVRDASLYALKSDFTQYSAVTSITNANKTTWNKASVLITTGGGTNYLADDGTYKAAGGGVVPTDYTFKWDSGASYYRPYTTKTEAGGVLSAGKFYSGTDTPTATNRLNYDGDFYAHYFYGYRGEFTMVVGTTLNITSTTSVGGVMNSRGYTMSSNFGGNTTFSDNLLTVSRLVSDTVSSTGNILQLTDNPTSSGTISGALISGTVGTTERLRFDPRATSTGSTVSNFIDTHSVLNTGDKILSVRNHGNEIINVNPAGLKITGKLDVSGLIDPTGLQLDAVASNPGTSTTVWVNSGDNGLYYNTDKLGKAQSTGNTYNPANPFLFDNDYQYNNYTLSANITPTYSLTGAIALNGVSITFIGDGTHTVDFSNFVESDLSGAFDITNGAENKVIFYYDGIDVIYSIVSSAKIASSTVTGLLSNTDWSTFNSKQAALVSGTNIKTINSTTILGSGDIAVQATLVSGTNIKTINGTSLLGSGDITITAPTPTDNILDWDGTNSWYAPYSSKQASMSFYTGNTDPTLTTRLNLDADLHATSSHFKSNSEPTIIYAENNKLSGDAYAFFGVSNSPSKTSVANYFRSSAGIGASISSYTGTQLYVGHNDNLGSESVSSNWIKINRSVTTTGSVTSNIIDITDNPTTSGTISGKVLSATIGSAERISLNPRVTDGATAIAYTFDTHTSLVNNGAKLFSVRNGGNEYFSVGATGNINGNVFNGIQSILTNSISAAPHLQLKNSTTTLSNFYPTISDGASAIAYLFDTHNNLATTGAKLVSVKNQGVEKVYFSNHGNIARTVGTSSTFATVGGVLKDFYSDVSTSGTSETDLYSYTIPANTLANDGDKLEFKFIVDVHTIPTSSYIRLYFAGMSSTSILGTLGTVNQYLVIYGTIIRTSSSTFRYFQSTDTNTTTNGYSVMYVAPTGKNFTIDNLFKITGQCATNSITARMGYIEYKPAAIN